MKNTLAAKISEGFHSQGWQVLGRGGTWAGAMSPLEAYVNRKIERAVKAEREACAKVCEEADLVEYEHCMVLHTDGPATLRNAAAAIRARGNT